MKKIKKIKKRRKEGREASRDSPLATHVRGLWTDTDTIFRGYI